MRWCAPGFEQALEDLGDLLETTDWPGPPAGFEPVAPARPMRTVLRGSWEGPAGPVPVVVKWSRPDTATDRLSRRVRGGKGPREGRVLRALEVRGVRVPRALAYGDEGPDVLVTAALEDLRHVRDADRVPAAAVRDAAALLAAAHAAGLRHRDLHLANLGLTRDGPVLVDLGGARLGAALEGRARRRALARLGHGLLGRARRSQRLRALLAYMRAVHGERGAAAARTAARPLQRAAERAARRYRRGRDRRATRDGRHFVTFTAPGMPHGIRRRAESDAAWEQSARSWMAGRVEDGVPLKAGGGVLRAQVGGRSIVVKRFGPTLRGRLPRPLRAFRRAWALEHRHLAVPRALLAAAGPDGSGVCVSAWVDARDLHAFTQGGRGGALAALPVVHRHRSLERLGRNLRALHEACVSHRDLKAPNLLARRTDDGVTMLLADLEGVRIRRRPVPWARRARDLARLDASLGALATDRLRVLRAYMRVPPRPPVTLRRMAERIAEHVRRKRGPAGQPR